MKIGLLPPEALIELVENLRDRDWTLTMRHYVALHDLVLLLIAKGHGDEDVARLHSLFRPILSSSPQEQLRFSIVFNAWSKRVAARMEESASTPRPIAAHRRDVERSVQTLNEDLEKLSSRAARTRRLLILAAVFAALAIAGSAYFYIGT
jgi:hypothetical protein